MGQIPGSEHPILDLDKKVAPQKGTSLVSQQSTISDAWDGARSCLLHWAELGLELDGFTDRRERDLRNIRAGGRLKR